MMHNCTKKIWRIAFSTWIVLLSGCGGGNSDHSDNLTPYKTQKLEWVACEPSLLAADESVLQRFQVKPADLGSRLTCAYMRAPLDYANPSRGDIVVAFMRAAAEDSASRKGAILFNPGGPGGDGLVFAPLYGTLWSRGSPENPTGALYRQISREFDLIGFSPRGAGASTHLYCGTNGLFNFVGTESDRTPRNINAMLGNAKLKAQACVQNPLTPYINTDATARDLDLFRHLLGDEKLNYLGMSYGTWLGHWYASLFPERVGAMLLSGVVDLTRGIEETFLQQPMGFQRAFDNVIVPYAKRHSSLFSIDGSAAELGMIYQSLSSRPFLQASVGEVISEQMGSSFHASDAVLTMVAAKWLFNKLDTIVAPTEMEKESTLRSAITSAAIAHEVVDPGDSNPNNTLNKRAKTLAGQIADQYFGRLSGEQQPISLEPYPAMNFVVVANDSPMRLGIDEWIAATNYNVSMYPLIGGRFTDWPGLYWQPTGVVRPPLSNAARAKGIVLLHAENDARTPKEGAEASLRILPNASYISIADEYWHGVALPYGQPCVDTPIAKYFLFGTQPASRIQCNGNVLPWDKH
jgi:pimeloyl-ACP methyl ester carboxylesterase